MGLNIKLFSLAVVREWGLAILVILAVLTAFGLGRLSVLLGPNPAVIVQNASAAGVAEPIRVGGGYIAARGGSVYYFPWCSGAESIQPELQVWFATESAAQKAGYRPAKNCKGL
jgi:hypothetical protein